VPEAEPEHGDGEGDDGGGGGGGAATKRPSQPTRSLLTEHARLMGQIAAHPPAPTPSPGAPPAPAPAMVTSGKTCVSPCFGAWQSGCKGGDGQPSGHTGKCISRLLFGHAEKGGWRFDADFYAARNKDVAADPASNGKFLALHFRR
jgi:hypothetical protein